MVKVLCCFAILKKENSTIPFILDQLSIAVSTLSTHDALTFFWCITQVAPTRKELIVRVVDDIERRELTADQKRSFLRNRSLVDVEEL